MKSIEREMQLKQLKIELIQILLNSDELTLLEKIRNEFLKDIETPGASKVVGYNSEGEPVTKKEMERQLRESLKQAEQGDVVDLDDLKNEAENW